MSDPNRSTGIDFTDDVEPHFVTFDATGVKFRQRETPEEILRWMKARLKFHGSPLPEGYVPPPGIDIDALLRQLPPHGGRGPAGNP